MPEWVGKWAPLQTAVFKLSFYYIVSIQQDK